MRVLPLETSFTGHRCVCEWVAAALWLFAGGLPVLGVWQIMYTILPAAGLFLICLFWFLLWFYRYFTMKRHIPAEVATLRRTHAESCIVSVLVFAFFIHPTITQQVGAARACVCVCVQQPVSLVLGLCRSSPPTQTFKIFTCRQLDEYTGKWWLVADLDVECYDTKHWAWMMGVGMFRMLAYVIAIPATAFYVMWRVRGVWGRGGHASCDTLRSACVLCSVHTGPGQFGR